MRIKRRGGGVCLYVHNSLQYKVINYLTIGNDQETINSVFVEIDKTTTNTKRNYYLSTQEACTYFQTLIDYYFKESFQKQTVTITYRNRYSWMPIHFVLKRIRHTSIEKP